MLRNPYLNNSQLEGLLYFLYVHNIYFKRIKANTPETWQTFFDKNKSFLNKLFTPSLRTLREISYCKRTNNDQVVEFYINLLKDEDLSILEEITSKDQVQILKCSSMMNQEIDLDNINHSLFSPPKKQC